MSAPKTIVWGPEEPLVTEACKALGVKAPSHDWAAVYAEASAHAGPVVILLDDSCEPAVVPPGTYDGSNITFVGR